MTFKSTTRRTKETAMTTNIVLCILLLPWYVSAQTSSKDFLHSYFTEVRSGQYPSIHKYITLQENAKTTLRAIAPYLKDTAVVVRAKAYAIVQIAGNNSRKSNEREDAVKKLLEGVKDPDAGNAGLALSYLTEFRKVDFTVSAKDSIRAIFYRKSSHFDDFIKLVGFLDLQDMKESIRPYKEKGNHQSVRWAAILALARMGDSAAFQDMMRRVRKLPVNDEVVYDIFPALVYTRQKEAINYMIQAMNSDDKNCEGADAEKSVRIACGYRIMEQLAPVVEGYPLTLDESGDIKTKDYVEALITIREWFVKNPNYKLNEEKF